jgi:hypothetical protein
MVRFPFSRRLRRVAREAPRANVSHKTVKGEVVYFVCLIYSSLQDVSKKMD